MFLFYILSWSSHLSILDLSTVSLVFDNCLNNLDLHLQSITIGDSCTQTWNLSKNLHRWIFTLKILHRQFYLISTVLVRKKHKKWVKMEKFTPLAKILHCRRQWRHWKIPPLGFRNFFSRFSTCWSRTWCPCGHSHRRGRVCRAWCGRSRQRTRTSSSSCPRTSTRRCSSCCSPTRSDSIGHYRSLSPSWTRRPLSECTKTSASLKSVPAKDRAKSLRLPVSPEKVLCALKKNYSPPPPWQHPCSLSITLKCTYYVFA